jgi:hypothetical protein
MSSRRRLGVQGVPLAPQNDTMPQKPFRPFWPFSLLMQRHILSCMFQKKKEKKTQCTKPSTKHLRCKGLTALDIKCTHSSTQQFKDWWLWYAKLSNWHLKKYDTVDASRYKTHSSWDTVNTKWRTQWESLRWTITLSESCLSNCSAPNFQSAVLYNKIISKRSIHWPKQLKMLPESKKAQKDYYYMAEI